MNRENIDKLIAYMKRNKLTSITTAAHDLAPDVVENTLRPGSTNCQKVAEWLGLSRDKGVYLLFVFDKNGGYHTSAYLTHEKVVSMLERLRASGGEQIYYD